MSIRTKLSTFRIAICAFALFATLIGDKSSLADEWETNTWRYEDDAWYDISEWFDGNDYNPTDEIAGKWDDEIYNPSVNDDDQDNDWNTYDDDSYYGGYDYDYGYHYDHADNEYDYGGHYDYGTKWSYGYDDRYDADDWFYDYWDEGYAYYSDWDSDGIYDYSYVYYDYDGDGFYDAYYTNYDWDSDGYYDDSYYYSFSDVSNQNKQQSDQQQSTQSKQRRVQGKVISTKKVSVRDTKHLVVRLKKDDGNRCLIDLGPAKKLEDLDIDQNSRIEARGPVSKVGEKKVLIAQQVKADGKSKKIERDRQKLRGQIADTRKSTIRGEKHLIAILSTGKDKKTLLDLGPVGRMDTDLEQDDEIEVQGAPVKVNDKKMLVVHVLRHDGDKKMIDRSQNNKGGKQQAKTDRSKRQQRDSHPNNYARSDSQQGRRFEGEVVSTKTISVRGKQRQTVTIKNSKGNRMLVDLGAAGQVDAELDEGDQVAVRGTVVSAGDGKPVVLARSLRLNGEDIDLSSRRSGSNRNHRSVSGEIESTRTVNVQGQQHKLVKLETDEGKSILVDVGKARDLDVQLRDGENLTAHGIRVKAGDHIVLVAHEIETDGESVTVARSHRGDKRSKATTD